MKAPGPEHERPLHSHRAGRMQIGVLSVLTCVLSIYLG